MALAMSSAHGEEWFGHKLRKNPKMVTTDVHKAFIYAKAPTKDTTILKMMMNLDPHLDMIPQSLINFIMKNVIGTILGFIQKKSQKLP